MKNGMFAFGAGSRTCIGKNVSYLEIYKLVLAVFRSFDVGRVLLVDEGLADSSNR